MVNKRRNFIKTLSLATESMALSGSMTDCNKRVKPDFAKISQIKKPLAIAMWDYSWILCHHKFREFEDWDQVLQGIVERGYNALRIKLILWSSEIKHLKYVRYAYSPNPEMVIFNQEGLPASPFTTLK